MTATISPSPHVQVDALQHRLAAIAGAQAFDRRGAVVTHGMGASRDRSPRRARRRRSRPSCLARRSRPKCSTVTRVRDLPHEGHVVLDRQHGHALARSARCTISPVRWVSSGDMPAVGSSSSSSCGFRLDRHADLQPLLLAVAEIAGRLHAASGRGSRKSSSRSISSSSDGRAGGAEGDLEVLPHAAAP